MDRIRYSGNKIYWGDGVMELFATISGSTEYERLRRTHLLTLLLNRGMSDQKYVSIEHLLESICDKL